MLKWVNVKELVRLDLDESKSLGIMRLDWSGSRVDEVCNQWYPSQQFDEVITKYDISIQSLQEGLNELIFNQLNVFNQVIVHCGGEGYSYEQTFKVETSDFNFFIRLKPVRGECSHIFVYYR